MFRKLFFLIFLLAIPLFAQYNFTFTCVSDTFQALGPGDVAYFYFHLQNTGSVQDIYEFNCTIIDSVPDWFVLYCIGGI